MAVEAEILLACARASLTPEARARLAGLLDGAVDWARLIALAERHGLLPLVSHHLAATPGHAVPEAAREELQTRARAIVGRNLMFASELVRVIGRLEARGIPVLPYKGPQLAVAAYGNLASRSFDDLDLLIPRPHVLEAARLLGEDGYRPLYELTPAQEAAYLRSQCEYIVERGGVRIELHWEIVPRYFGVPFDLEGLWARAEWNALAGATLRTLSAEDLLLVLCAHGAKHCWDRLEWVASFAEVARRRPTMDWGEIRRRASRARARRMLDLSLWLTYELMDVALPAAEIEQIARDPVARTLARETAGRLLSGETGVIGRTQEVRFHLRSRDGLADRLRYAFRLGTTQTLGDWAFLDLPPRAQGVYRVLRPLRLLGKFGPSAIARALGALSTTARPEGDGPERPR